MATDDSLQSLIESAQTCTEARWVSPLIPALSGVDPLGMRQTNFDLMDRVLPGLNNTARHIRPFTVVAWAWWKAAQVATTSGRKKIAPDLLINFVERIEVVFAWSQFSRSSNSALPGKNVLAPLLNAGQYTFSGRQWDLRRKERKYSTALSAPVNYGPSLKSLGWIVPHPRERLVFVPKDSALPAIEALDRLLQSHLQHPLFASFGDVTVDRDFVDTVGEVLAMETLTEPERQFVCNALIGSFSRPALRMGILLASTALQSLESEPDVTEVRRRMAEPESDIFASSCDLVTAATAWKVVQLRQVFRLAMEALLHWGVLQLRNGTQTTSQLSEIFISEVGSEPLVRKWLTGKLIDGDSIDWLDKLENALASGETAAIAKSVRAILANLLAEPLSLSTADERQDRLPLSRAIRELQAFGDRRPIALMGHIIERWVFGQHVYWALGRGLSDARGNQRQIFRLKVALEEGGWTLTSGTKAGSTNAPSPTPDRLYTALTLIDESRLLENATYLSASN
jgi:hypothetical protein